MILYFAYGSNLDASHMQYRCPNAGVPNPGCLKGFRLDFTRYSPKWSCGVADVVESEGGEVWGLVYEITKSDRDALDMYEGHPKRYIRSETTIHTKEEELEKVWMYTVREKAGFPPPIKAI